MWLQTLHQESKGNADLVAHFYRLAFNLLRKGGTFGLIATNTISQGHTRATGLRWLRSHDGVIFAARKRIKWPGKAAVIVSVVYVHKGALKGPFDLDGQPVEQITAFLFHLGADEPVALQANSESSYIGSYVNSMGFTFDDSDGQGKASSTQRMRELIALDARNAERIRPYWGGEELNETWAFDPTRFVVDFDSMSESEARRWPDLMRFVEERVKPERLANNDEHARTYWWQFLRPREELYRKLAKQTRTLVIARNSNTGAFVWMPADHVFSEKTVVFPTESDSFAAVVQSRVHETWSRMLNTTFKDDLQYTPSECFENFPMPSNWPTSSTLIESGLAYFRERAAALSRLEVGLTELYGRFNDPEEHEDDILRLRQLHDVMDRAVLDAYYWTDIPTRCEFILDYEDDENETPGKPSKKRKPWRYRWPDEIRDKVLGRLLALNAECARDEALTGAAIKSPDDASASKKKRKLSATSSRTLLD